MAEEHVPAQKTPPGGLWYRHRYLVIGLLTSNAAMAAYWLLTKEPPKVSVKLPPPEEAEEKSDGSQKEKITAPDVLTVAQAGASSAIPAEEKVEPQEQTKQQEVPAVAKLEPKKLHPIPKDEQIEVYKWILSEKRKVKPSSSEEKSRIDLEKGILKDYIRGKRAIAVT